MACACNEAHARPPPSWIERARGKQGNSGEDADDIDADEIDGADPMHLYIPLRTIVGPS